MKRNFCRFSSILLTVIFLFALNSCDALNGLINPNLPQGEGEPLEISEGLELVTNGDGTCRVDGIGTCEDTVVVIPETSPDGENVVSIGDNAFDGCTSLISVTIPDSVTSIGDYAFEDCTSLTSVTIGDGVTSIGSSAFWSCYKLVEVINHSSLDITAGSSSNGYVAYYAKEVHNGESKIVNKDGYLFITSDGVNYLLGYAGNDTELNLPDSYNGEDYVIYDYAFYQNGKITSVTIGDSVTSIGYGAFYYCTSLTSVTIPDSVTSIGVTLGEFYTMYSYPFMGCKNLTSIYYCGNAEKWSSVLGTPSSEQLAAATLYYYSENAPETNGNYWHYDEDGNVAIWE